MLFAGVFGVVNMSKYVVIALFVLATSSSAFAGIGNTGSTGNGKGNQGNGKGNGGPVTPTSVSTPKSA